MSRNEKPRLIQTILILIILLSLVIGCTKEQVEVGKKIEWSYNLDVALAKAQEQKKPVLIDFMADWCPPCGAMEDSTFSNPNVIRKVNNFVPLRIDVDKHQEIANKYNANAQKYGGIGIPNMLFMTGDEVELKHAIGYRGPKEFIAVLDSVLAMLEE